MNWYLTYAADPRASRLADKHYSRQKPGTPEFSPPGRKIVLIDEVATAIWVTSWPFAQYVHRDYQDAWNCTIFRNESGILSSQLILEAVACTRWKYPAIPASGMITMVDADKTRHKRDPGRCYRKAGFVHVGFTKGGLYILQLKPEDMPEAESPNGATMDLWEVAVWTRMN